MASRSNFLSAQLYSCSLGLLALSQISCNSPATLCATVELDGVAIGTTPCEKDFPGGYFHKTKTSFGARREHPWLHALASPATPPRNSRSPKAVELAVAEWPQPWRVLALQDGSFPCGSAAHLGSFHRGDRRESFRRRRRVQPELSLEELVRQTKPAVVYLKALDKSGTGFFVTGTGVLVTNAHVAAAKNHCLRCSPAGSKSRPKSFTLMRSSISPG